MTLRRRVQYEQGCIKIASFTEHMRAHLAATAESHFKLLGRSAQGGGAGSNARECFAFSCEALGGDTGSTKFATLALVWSSFKEGAAAGKQKKLTNHLASFRRPAEGASECS